MAETHLHPLLDRPAPPETAGFAGGTLVCHCTDRPVKIAIDNQVLFNHACGCTKCWKPANAVFSVVGVVPVGKVRVLQNGDKLAVVDPSALIQRHACKACGVHMHGPVERDHAFKGLSFIHAELSHETGWAPPGFAAFVSSVIEGGVAPDRMDAIRARIREVGIEPYDCLSPALMDMLATYAATHAKKTDAVPA